MNKVGVDNAAMNEFELNEGVVEVNGVEVNDVGVNESKLNEGDMNKGEMNNGEVNDAKVNNGGIIGSQTIYDNDDMSFNYDSALDIAFEDSSEGNDEFMEEDMKNILGYANDIEGTSKKIFKKRILMRVKMIVRD